jgi:hypothetical protein
MLARSGPPDLALSLEHGASPSTPAGGICLWSPDFKGISRDKYDRLLGWMLTYGGLELVDGPLIL